jgi:hypothetical protein
VAAVDPREVDLVRAPGIGEAQEVRRRADDVAGDAEHLAQDVRRASGQARQRGRGAGEAVGDLVDRPVAAERHDDVVALVRRLAGQLDRVPARLRVDRVDLVARLQRVQHERPDVRRHRRRVRVDDQQHPLAIRRLGLVGELRQAVEIGRRGGHRGSSTPSYAPCYGGLPHRALDAAE